MEYKLNKEQAINSLRSNQLNGAHFLENFTNLLIIICCLSSIKSLSQLSLYKYVLRANITGTKEASSDTCPGSHSALWISPGHCYEPFYLTLSLHHPKLACKFIEPGAKSSDSEIELESNARINHSLGDCYLTKGDPDSFNLNLL
jgi:hypothetical protein